ncbi:MAG: hypothetical protein ABR510_03700 [Trueperaceae bacterium]
MSNRQTQCSPLAHAPSLAAALLVAFVGAFGVAFADVGVGLRAIDQGDFEGAIGAFEAAIAANDDDARAHLLLARAAVYAAAELPEDADADREALFARAADMADRAVRLAPGEPDAHFEVSRALGRLAQYRGVLQSLSLAARVERALERTLELDPDHAAAWHARGLFHHDVPWIAGGRRGSVAPSFERAIVLEPDEITHRLAFAQVLVDRDDFAAAIAQLEVAVGLRAATYLERKDLEAARALLAELR